jgi:hypothetical protein
MNDYYIGENAPDFISTNVSPFVNIKKKMINVEKRVRNPLSVDSTESAIYGQSGFSYATKRCSAKPPFLDEIESLDDLAFLSPPLYKPSKSVRSDLDKSGKVDVLTRNPEDIISWVPKEPRHKSQVTQMTKENKFNIRSFFQSICLLKK